MRIRLTIVVFCVLLGQSTRAANLIDECYSDMYNLAFADAHRCFERWENAHPDDPIGPVSDAAAYLFSEFERLRILQSEFFVNDNSSARRTPLTPDPAIKQKFDAALARTQTIADRRLARSENDKQAMFANILRLGLTADYLALIQKHYLLALKGTEESRRLAARLLAVDPKMYDAYLAIGVENYLLSLKAAPVRWLLHMQGAQTNRETGIANLRLTAEHGRYLRPYAELLLSVAALRDHNQSEAKRLLADLAAQFPRNHLYRDELRKLN